LRLKAVGFYREIEDYIAMGRIGYAETDRRYTAYVNLDGKTRMRGVEIEASYDARTWYLGGSFTWNEADYPKWYKLPAGSGLGYLGPETSVIFVQPARRLALD